MIILAGEAGGLQSVLNVISLVLMFVIVIVLAYFTSKLAAKYQKNVIGNKSNIRVIEYFKLGGNKLIAIVKICDEYYALGIGKDEITSIDKLNPDAVKIRDDNEKETVKVDFKEILSQIKKKSSKDNNDVK